MKGLELARTFYYEEGRPLLAERFPELAGKWAAGLVGEGSECFGFDDEISRDHDWGPGFCIWLTGEQYESCGEKMQQVYDSLPGEFRGYRRRETVLAGKRTGIFCVEEFYERFLGLRRAPEDLTEWMRIPENYLAVAVNGEVFEDGTGAFSEIRKKLLGFYPEDVRKKKIAARLAVMAREGQHHYPRCLKRMDFAAAFQALARFSDAAVSVMYLLKKGYTPYYKWAFRGLERWPECGHYARLLQELAGGRKVGRGLACPSSGEKQEPARQEALEGGWFDAGRKEEHSLSWNKRVKINKERSGPGKEQHSLSWNENVEMIEQIAEEVIWELRMQGLSNVEGNFLQDHGFYVMSEIQDERIRRMHILEG